MDFKEIKQIVELMKRSELTEFEIKDKDLKLRITRQQAGMIAPQALAIAPMQAAAAPTATDKPVITASTEEAGVHLIKSPMVGTFYRSTSPDNDPFVDISSKVTKDSVVCIIEAMKVMNEIQAEVSGTITELLVENGDPVEYGQPLYKVKKT